MMREHFLYTPGPTHLPLLVRQQLAVEPIHHRSTAFSELVKNCASNLKKVFCTQGEVAIMTCTGSGAMEAAVVNTIAPGSAVLCVEGGKFGRRWSEICRRVACEVIPIVVPPGKDLEPEKLEAELRSHSQIKAVFLTHTESSSGAIFNIQKLTEIVKRDSEAMVVVDAFGSIAADPFLQDQWGVDIATCGSQKALMCPPGLGFVSVSTEGFGKLIKPASLYWDLMDHFKMQKDGFNPFTPAIHTINALKFSLEMILNKGIENIWQETNRLASAFREAILVGGLELFPQKPASGLTVIKLPDNIKDQQVINELEKSSGYRIAGGQEELAGKVIRIAHMGAVSFEDIKRLIAPLFDTLQRLGHDCQSELVYEKFVKTYSSL